MYMGLANESYSGIGTSEDSFFKKKRRSKRRKRRRIKKKPLKTIRVFKRRNRKEAQEKAITPVRKKKETPKALVKTQKEKKPVMKGKNKRIKPMKVKSVTKSVARTEALQSPQALPQPKQEEPSQQKILVADAPIKPPLKKGIIALAVVAIGVILISQVMKK